MFDNRLVTVWSAPNYCYRCGNLASILQLGQNLEQGWQDFDAVPDEKTVVPSNKPIPYFL